MLEESDYINFKITSSLKDILGTMSNNLYTETKNSKATAYLNDEWFYCPDRYCDNEDCTYYH